MITLKTITTIELANVCNLQCKYCVNRKLVVHPNRKPGIMTDEIFEASLIWLSRLCDQDTQREVNLNGTGESCLDPKLITRIRRVKDIMGARPVQFCTNGVNMTDVLARQLAGSGIDRVDLSPHSAYHARKAVQAMSRAGIKGIVSMGSILYPHNWAGQLEPEHSVECNIDIPCDPIIEGRGYIQKEGDVTPCCYDYRSLGVFGHVLDDDLLNREIKPYSLCYQCHQTIPIEIWESRDRNINMSVLLDHDLEIQSKDTGAGVIEITHPNIKKKNITVSIQSTDAFILDDGVKYMEGYQGERKILVDVGAHVGTSSLFFATELGFEKVVAIEACKQNYDLLVRNIYMNKLQHIIEPVWAAVGMTTGEIKDIYMHGSNSGQCGLYLDNGGIKYGKTRMISMEDVIANIALKGCIDVLKVDAEGSEYEIFSPRGSLKEALKNVRFIELETHTPAGEFFKDNYFAEFGYPHQETANVILIEFLTDCGFDLTFRGETNGGMQGYNRNFQYREKEAVNGNNIKR